MPIEALLLYFQPQPLTQCPECHAHPFRAFMRGEVQRKWGVSLQFVKFLMHIGNDWKYCAVICWECKEVVGWE